MLSGLTIDPPLEFQRVPRPGPKRPDDTSQPRPIIACPLLHTQDHQLLLEARSHGPFKAEGFEVRITADISIETNDRRKAFLSLRSRLRQLEVKYGLFEPARMWITKGGKSRHYYDPEELHLYLD
ncbi:hypothetical protein NDU88_006538 [Pleurodeles waltl]|uniref:Uncharacterized protein n=1 Tax=Pleurodeles waltl TaxID=8319 RepID=A0AAV7TX32_PLEWA|nr:hypothetical protein NDU88_006538 [Pleurodeles waltl]